MENQQNSVEGLLRQILAQLNGRSGIDQLAKAYVAAWAELNVVVRDAENPHFGSNYATLDATLRAIRPVFAKHSLAILQSPGNMSADGARIAITSILMHSSGQHLVFPMELPLGDKPNAQKAGSAITYGRRYADLAIGGLAPADDDGNEASIPAPRVAGLDSGASLRTELDAKIDAAATAAELESLKKSVQDLGDNATAKKYVAKMRELNKGKEGKKS